jgi:phosphatidylinositol-3-phosphatase
MWNRLRAAGWVLSGFLALSACTGDVSGAGGQTLGQGDDLRHCNARHPCDASATDSGTVDACVPTTCSAAGKNCGSIADGCGGTLSCGTCPAGESCVSNVCQASTSGGVIQKVFYIMEENRNASDVYGASDAPYINGTLMTTYDWASDYTDVVHPSEPNYIWLEAGDNLGLTTDNDPSSSNSTATTDHLVNYLGRVGRTWKSYQENLPGSCGIHSSGSYAAKHNPFVFFQDVVGSYSSPSAFCTSHIVDFSQLATDLAAGNVADFVEITPNLCNDGHDCGNSTVETWLKSAPAQQVFNYVLNAANHAILVIDWDEGEGQGIHPMLLIAPPTTLAGTHQITTQVDHSSFVRSMQRIFGVDPSHIDPTTGAPFAWLRHASAVADFSSFFAPGQFP